MARFRGMLLPFLLLALLAVLAAFQYRWTGQISRAEQERMEASLRSSLGRFVRDVEAEIGTLFRDFRVDEPDSLGGRLERYRAEASYPELVEAVYFLDPGDGELWTPSESGTLQPAEWPRDLGKLRDRLRARRPTERGRRLGPLPLLSGSSPVIAIPVARPAPGRRWPAFFSGFTVVTLDVDVLRETILPALSERHFGDDYDVAVVDRNGDVLFTSGIDDTVTHRADARAEIFSFRRPPGRSRGPRGERSPPDDAELAPPPRAGGGSWEVFVRHRSGSLETVVAGARVRNLAVSFGILGILAASIVLVAVSTRRATELNDRKMEFVAGVSHELRTPVAVLRSAGQNLADGSVSDPDQVKRYGTLIESEGRRLDDLVEQVLELAGIQSHRRARRKENVSVKAVLTEALSDCETLRNERSVAIRTHVHSPDAVVIGDPEALRRVLANLISNAIKHGGDDNVVEIETGSRDGEIVVTVSDRGPGIPEEDRGKLFDAFYRGRRARERQVPGSGLGLSLVDHVVREHGGRVELASTPGKGSRFTVRLPAADEG